MHIAGQLAFIGTSKWKAWVESPDAKLINQTTQLRLIRLTSIKQQYFIKLANYEQNTNPQIPIPNV